MQVNPVFTLTGDYYRKRLQPSRVSVTYCRIESPPVEQTFDGLSFAETYFAILAPIPSDHCPTWENGNLSLFIVWCVNPKWPQYPSSKCLRIDTVTR